MANNKSCTIIGVSGCTNSGKTSMTKKLMKLFPGCSYLCQDSYFLEPGDKRLEYVEEVQHYNWEKLSALDMSRMVSDVKQWIKECESYQNEESDFSDTSSSVLFIEGYTIFNYSPLKELCHKKYFLTMDFNTCQQRRRSRNYIPADPVGYFEKVVWPMYLSNKKELQHYTDIVYCNGCNPQEKTLTTIFEDIQCVCQLRMLHHIS